MRLVKTFSFAIESKDPRSLLLAPERVFSALPVIKNLRRQKNLLLGELCGEFAIFGRLCFPFESELFATEKRAVLKPRPLAGDYWAELGGVAEAEGEVVNYRVDLALNAELAAGDKWGGRALLRMAEAVFAHHLNRALSAPKRLQLG